MKKTILAVITVLFFLQAQAQVEVVTELGSNELLRKGPSVNRSKGAAIDTLNLPFRDDFSNESHYPDSTLWQDNLVFINNTYPVNRLSYGVATFDGLNQFGQPHNLGSNVENGPADTLTSQNIDLSSLSIDDSIYLSFSYEAKGSGDNPDNGDSLLLEFKINDSVWNRIWSVNGITSGTSDNVFKDVFVLVSDPFYFRNDFQFRFRNLATITGNNDHWHIDYVNMDANRTILDSSKSDVAFTIQPTQFLGTYRSMPWSHFVNNQADELADSITFCIRNNLNTPFSPNISFDAFEVRSNTPLPSTPFVGSFTLQPEEERCFIRPVSAFAPFTFTPSPADEDSVVIALRTAITPASGDNYADNDTVEGITKFYNYFAYDDGSAEKAYGLQGATGLKKFAMQFHLNHSDTLRGVRFHFALTQEDASNELFSFFVWKNINMANVTGGKDDTLYYQNFQRPMYIDSLNGFAVFIIDPPLPITDSFFVGWQQTGQKNINVGLDTNSTARSHMFYNTNGTWFRSLVNAAVMINPVVGDYVDFVGMGEVRKLSSEIRVYPNPVQNLLYVDLVVSEKSQYLEVYDLAGKLVQREAHTGQPLDVSALQNGMYILKAVGEQTHTLKAARFIKMQ